MAKVGVTVILEHIKDVRIFCVEKPLSLSGHWKIKKDGKLKSDMCGWVV